MKLPVSMKITRGILLTCTLAWSIQNASAQTIHTFAGYPTTICSPDGIPATAAGLVGAIDVTIKGSGNVYIAEFVGCSIRKVNTTGIISTIAGVCGVSGVTGDGGPATAATLRNPQGVAVDGTGNVYFSVGGAYRIRKVNTAGMISVFAGDGTLGFSGDGGPATAARLFDPGGVAVDALGNVYIADRSNHRIRKVNTSGIISTFAGNGGVTYSEGVPATATAIGNPFFLTFDGAGNLYFTDHAYSFVRKINSAGIISTVAGTGLYGYSGDGGPATAATLNQPMGIAVDGAGNIYVADHYNHRVRRINTSGIISTYAGNGTAGFSGDGGPATAAKLNSPAGMSIDGAGNLYIVDGSGRVRIVTPPPAPPVFDGGSLQSLAVCENSTANPINSLLTVTDTATGLTETYSVTMAPAHGAITAGSSVTSGISVTPTGWAYTPTTGYSGIDSFSIQVSNGGNAAATTIIVTVNPLPFAGAITGTTMLCAGASAALSNIATGGVWSTATTGIITLSSSSGTTVTVTGVATGTDTVFYTVTNSCGTAAAYTVVTVNPLPFAGVITGTSPLCVDVLDTFTNAAPGGVWSSSAPGVATVSSMGGIYTVAPGVTIISYSVTNSCGTATATFTLNVMTSPTVPAISGPGVVCSGSSATLTMTDSGGVWSTAAGTATVSSTGVVTGTAAGTAVITYSKTNPCGSTHVVHTVTVEVLPVVTDIIGPYTLCADSTATLTDSTAGGTWTATNAHSTFTGGIVAGISPGFDTFTYSLTNTCGTTTVSHVIQILPCDSVLGTKHITRSGGITISPNPNDGTFTLLLSAPVTGPAEVTITDIAGKRVKGFSMETNRKTSITLDVAAGIYFVTATTSQGSYNSKIIVSK